MFNSFHFIRGNHVNKCFCKMSINLLQLASSKNSVVILKLKITVNKLSVNFTRIRCVKTFPLAIRRFTLTVSKAVWK